MRRVKLWQVALALLAALAALAVTAWLAERAEAVDQAASSYEWGGGPVNEPPPDSMVLVPSGEYLVGDEWPDAEADAPPRRIRLEAFYLDRQEVTNHEFARFVEATGHVTTAEREGGAWVYRGGALGCPAFIHRPRGRPGGEPRRA